MKTWKIVLIIIIIIALGFLGYYFYKKSANKKTATSVTTVSGPKPQKTTTTTSALAATPTPTSSEDDDWQQCAEIGAEESETMADWPTYVNETYNYRFSYPTGWTVSDSDPMNVTARGEDSGEEITFQVRNNRMTEIGFTEYNLVFTRDFTVNCENTTENTYDGEDNLTLLTYRFDKSDTPYLLIFSYKDIGASYSGDIYNIDKMILKTFSFRE